MKTIYRVGGRRSFDTLAQALEYAKNLHASTGVFASVEKKEAA